MKSKDIKEKCDKFIEDIKTAQFGLAELQDLCEHTETYEYGAMPKVELCFHCQKLMPQFYNSHLHFTEVQYSTICTACNPESNCNCSFKNTIVKQWFNLNK